MRSEPLMNLHYQENQKGMMLPMLQISENPEMDHRDIGKFGQVWKAYMMEHHPHRMTRLITKGKINEVILEMDRKAEEAKENYIQKLLQSYPMPETENLLKRIGHMNQITMMAEEIVMEEIIQQVK